MEISSITRISKDFSIFTTKFDGDHLPFLFKSFGYIPGMNPNALWMVNPPTFSAATPVGAVTKTALLLARSRKI